MNSYINFAPLKENIMSFTIKMKFYILYQSKYY